MFLPTVFLGMASVNLMKLKAQALEIAQNMSTKEIKIKKKGLWGYREQIFKMNEVEYLYSLSNRKIFLAIFMRNDEYFVYLIPVIEDQENFDRCLELMNEIEKNISKAKKK